MSKPTFDLTDPRLMTVPLLLSPVEYALITVRALRAGMQPTEWVRARVLAEAPEDGLSDEEADEWMRLSMLVGDASMVVPRLLRERAAWRAGVTSSGGSVSRSAAQSDPAPPNCPRSP